MFREAPLRLIQIAATLTVALAFSGCAPDFTIDNCQTDEDCFVGEICTLGTCQIGTVEPDMPEEDMPEEADMLPDMPDEVDMPPDMPLVTVDSVRLSPLESTLDLLDTVQLELSVLDADGNEIQGRTATWESSLETVATVDENGLVTARGEGSATIRASVDGVEGEATISVIKAPVANVTLIPDSAMLGVGNTVVLSARVEDAVGGELPGREVSWSSDDESIATVDDTGEVTGVALGSTTIVATAEGEEATASIEVVPEAVSYLTIDPVSASIEVAETVQLTARTFDADDNELMGRTIAWLSTDNAVATVDADGLVTGEGAGSAMISATSEGQSEMVMVTVSQRTVDSVDVIPSTTTLNPSDTIQFSAIPRASDGTALTGRTVTWSSDDMSVATVSSGGLVTAQMVGATLINAEVDGVTGSGNLDVVEAVDSVDVTPTSGAADIGETITFSATPRDGEGNALSGRTCTFSSQNMAVANVDMNTGVATIAAEGDTTITATCEGVQGVAAIAGLGPVATVTVTPSSATIALSATQQFSVELRDSSNHLLTGRTVTWSSSDGTIASVDPAGLATASATNSGTVTITATSEGIDGTASLTVQP